MTKKSSKMFDNFAWKMKLLINCQNSWQFIFFPSSNRCCSRCNTDVTPNKIISSILWCSLSFTENCILRKDLPAKHLEQRFMVLLDLRTQMRTLMSSTSSDIQACLNDNCFHNTNLSWHKQRYFFFHLKTILWPEKVN